mmetsp:Transcript_75232/g.212781  ORF Transcript_75232/g.212781 Transcript_75232/m.212781 type:complete len:202 (-) Transcript_75232:983-1588(-)
MSVVAVRPCSWRRPSSKALCDTPASGCPSRGRLPFSLTRRSGVSREPWEPPPASGAHCIAATEPEAGVAQAAASQGAASSGTGAASGSRAAAPAVAGASAGGRSPELPSPVASVSATESASAMTSFSSSRDAQDRPSTSVSTLLSEVPESAAVPLRTTPPGLCTALARPGTSPCTSVGAQIWDVRATSSVPAAGRSVLELP